MILLDIFYIRVTCGGIPDFLNFNTALLNYNLGSKLFADLDKNEALYGNHQRHEQRANQKYCLL